MFKEKNEKNVFVLSILMGIVISFISKKDIKILDRYYTLLYSYLHWYTFLLGFCILTFFYMGYLTIRKQ